MTPWLLSVAAFGTLLFTLINRFTWPSGRREGAVELTVSVLIPARNEEATIEASARSALAEPVHEVIVYDDGSTDDTRGILERIDDPRLVVLTGGVLPAGWVGKPHACHRLSEAATGDVLLFLDADVTLRRGGLGRLFGLLESWKAAVVTAVPHQELGTLAERLVVPLLHLTYTSWLPQVLVPLIPWRSVLAANGQVLLVRRSVYDDLGGFEAVKHEVVDDMAFCRLAKRRHHRVVFADGEAIASCRMYTTPTEVWRGFSKNLYEGLGSPLLLGVVLCLYTWAFLLPWLALPLALYVPQVALPALAGVAANLAQRTVLALRHGHPWQTVLLHPLGVLAFLGIALNSYRWSSQGTIWWAGRMYSGGSVVR